MPGFLVSVEFSEEEFTMARVGNAFKGRDRRLIQKLKKTCEQIQRMDDRRTEDTPEGGTPSTFKKAPSTHASNKLFDLIARCDEVLAARMTVVAGS
jgi:hypothetical protein